MQQQICGIGVQIKIFVYTCTDWALQPPILDKTGQSLNTVFKIHTLKGTKLGLQYTLYTSAGC